MVQQTYVKAGDLNQHPGFNHTEAHVGCCSHETKTWQRQWVSF